jgi:phosphatidylethanolamine-binding protein (PEBP) family uncharacterized protein
MVLADGAMFPTSATCATTGTPESPDLEWTGVPSGTMSFALVFVDTTITEGDAGIPLAEGYHYVLWDIPGGVTSLPMALPSGDPPMGVSDLAGAMQKGLSNNAQWLGPCPNGTSGTTRTDSYELQLYAFSTATQSTIQSSQSTEQIIQAIQALPNNGKAVLHGKSNAAGTLR